MKAAAIYARVSSEQQKEENTIASQTAALIEFAREQRQLLGINGRQHHRKEPDRRRLLEEGNRISHDRDLADSAKQIERCTLRLPRRDLKPGPKRLTGGLGGHRGCLPVVVPDRIGRVLLFYLNGRVRSYL